MSAAGGTAPIAPALEDGPGRGPGTGARIARLLAVLFLVALDQVSKLFAFRYLDGGPFLVEDMVRDVHGHERVPILGEHLALMRSCNPGAAFGRFGDYPHLLVGGRVVAVALLAWLLMRHGRRERLGLFAIVLVLAGALGNLIDNLGPGCVDPGHPYGLVRDFIDVWFYKEAWGWDYHFPTFNVADSCITVGAVAWILAGFFPRRARHAGEAEETGVAV